MQSVREAIIRIMAVNNTKSAFAAGMGDIDKTTARLNKLGTQMQLAGFRMVGATAPAALAARNILNAGKEFSRASNELEAVITSSIERDGLDRVETMKKLADEAKRIAEVSKFDAIEVTDAQKFLGMAGLGANQVLGASSPVVEASTALAMDVETAADKLSNAVLSFRLPGGTSDDPDQVAAAFRKVGDAAAYAAANSNVSGTQIFESLKSLGPVAVATGSSLEEMLSMVSALGDKKVSG